MDIPSEATRFALRVMGLVCCLALPGAHLAGQIQQCARYITLQEAQQKYGQRECKCEERSKIEDFLENEVQRKLRAINEVVKQGSQEEINKRLPGLTNSELSIGQIRWDKDFKVCTPVACEKFVQDHCKAIWKSTFVHEQAHCDWETQNLRIGWRIHPLGSVINYWWIRFNFNKLTAMEEGATYKKQADFLNQQLTGMPGCTWRCKCTEQVFESPEQCSRSCPAASMSCTAPTCYEIDPKTGKDTGRAH